MKNQKSPERQRTEANKSPHLYWICSFCEDEAHYYEADGKNKLYYCHEHVGRSKFYGGVQTGTGSG